MKTYYDILGVSKTATVSEIKKAYRRKVRETHPDTGGDVDAFREVQRAYEVLSNKNRRAQYDRDLQAAPTSRPPVQTSQGWDINPEDVVAQADEVPQWGTTGPLTPDVVEELLNPSPVRKKPWEYPDLNNDGPQWTGFPQEGIAITRRRQIARWRHWGYPWRVALFVSLAIIAFFNIVKVDITYTPWALIYTGAMLPAVLVHPFKKKFRYVTRPYLYLFILISFGTTVPLAVPLPLNPYLLLTVALYAVAELFVITSQSAVGQLRSGPKLSHEEHVAVWERLQETYASGNAMLYRINHEVPQKGFRGDNAPYVYNVTSHYPSETKNVYLQGIWGHNMWVVANGQNVLDYAWDASRQAALKEHQKKSKTIV